MEFFILSSFNEFIVRQALQVLYNVLWVLFLITLTNFSRYNKPIFMITPLLQIKRKLKKVKEYENLIKENDKTRLKQVENIKKQREFDIKMLKMQDELLIRQQAQRQIEVKNRNDMVLKRMRMMNNTIIE